MAYTYRFLDKENNVIYVGYTAQTMAQRMRGQGGLASDCT